MTRAASKDTPTPPAATSPKGIEKISFKRMLDDGLGLPERQSDSHKGDYGHVVLVGGDTGFGGAITLAVQACYRSGAGLVSCATRSGHVPVVLSRIPEAMVMGVESGLELQPLLQKASVIGCGPGLGQSSWSELLLQQVLQVSTPLVLDADGLNILASPGWQIDFSSRAVILTPHPGEAARLLKISTAEVQERRVHSVQTLAKRFGAIVVLKGKGTLIATPTGAVVQCTDGNSGMSTGGMGDVLTGVISALLAQGLEPWHAARLGVCVHSAAADHAAKKGKRGLMASDLFKPLREYLN